MAKKANPSTRSFRYKSEDGSLIDGTEDKFFLYLTESNGVVKKSFFCKNYFDVVEEFIKYTRGENSEDHKQFVEMRRLYEDQEDNLKVAFSPMLSPEEASLLIGDLPNECEGFSSAKV